MTKEEEEKAAADKAAADKAAADKAAADSAPSADERKAAEERRAVDEKAQRDRLDAADQRSAKLEEKIKELKIKAEADASKGKVNAEMEQRVAELERRLVDSNKEILQLNEDKKHERERADAKTLETDLRKVLDSKLVDGEALDYAIDHLILKGKARVDSDGKVAVVDEKGNWGSLSAETALKHVPKSMQLPKGAPGGGMTGPGGEVITSDLKTKVFGSQREFNKAVDAGLILDGDGRRVASK